jgi:hypothetical protein
MIPGPDSNPLGGQAQNNAFENIDHCQRDLQPAEAMQLFDKMEQMGVLNADVLNRTARARISAEWESLKERNFYGHNTQQC